MCAFWNGITGKPFNPRLPCANQPFPYPGTSEYTWPDSFEALRPSWGKVEEKEMVAPQALEAVWEPVKGDAGSHTPPRAKDKSQPDPGKPWLAASLAFCATVTKGRPLGEMSPEELPDTLPSYDVVFQGF